MGFYADKANKKTSQGFYGSKTKKSSALDLEGLQSLFQEAGYQAPKPEGPSLFNRAMGILSSLETGNAAYGAMYENKNPFTTYASDIWKGLTQGMRPDKKTWSDVLAKGGMGEGPKVGPVSARGVAGFVGDVLLDPSTYVGGSILKYGGKGLGKVGKTAFKVAEKTPVMGKYVSKAGEAAVKAKEAAENVLVPYAKIKRMGPEGEKLAEVIKENSRSFRGDVLSNTESLYGLKKILKEEGVEGDAISKIIESGEPIDASTLTGGVADYISNLFKRFASEEGKRGLLKTNMEDYVPHILTDEWNDFIKGPGGKTIQAVLPRPIMSKLKSAKPRTILKTIEEINQQTMEKYGKKMFEDDIFKIAAVRGVDHFRAIKTYDLIKYVESNFGLSTKLLPGIQKQMVVDGIKYVPFKPEGGIRIFKTVNDPSKDILKQLGFTKGRGFERSMTETGELLKLADQLGIPVVKNNRLRSALGLIRNRQMYPDSVIELQSFNPEVLAHEEGHLWDWLFGKKIADVSPDLQSKFTKEFEWAARNLPKTYKGKPYASKSTEQFAEAMSNFVANRPSAELMMPQFTAYMDKFVKSDPDIYQKFGNLKKLFDVAREKYPVPLPSKNAAVNTVLNENLVKGVQAAFPKKTGLGITTKVKEYLLPEPIAKHLHETYKMWTDDESIHAFIKAYDKVLNLWKGSVTGVFPAFHARNMMGGMWNNYLAGMPLGDLRPYVLANKVAREGAEGTVKIMGKPRTYEELRLLMKQEGVLGQTGMIDVGKKMEEVLNPRTGLKKALDYPKMFMGEVENTLRGSLFIDGLQKGMTPREAAKRVLTFHFDYTPEGLTTFERSVMKRLIPFYTWTRNNIPLQISQMIQQPGKFAGAGKALRSLSGETAEERVETEKLPDYMKEVPPIRLGGTEENPQYLYGLGMPFEDINRLGFNDLLSQMVPLVKTPLEIKTGYNFYTDQPTKKTIKAPSYVKAFPEQLKKMVGYHEGKNKQGDTIATVDPEKMAYITAMAGRLGTNLDKMSSEKESLFSKVIYGLFGTRAKTINLKEEEDWRARERLNQMMEGLARLGILKEYSNYYQPKK